MKALVVLAALAAACTSPTAPTSADLAPASAVVEQPMPSVPVADLPRVTDADDADVPMLLEAPIETSLLPPCKVTQRDLTRALWLLNDVAPRVHAGLALRFNVSARTRSKPWLQLGGILTYRGATRREIYSTTAPASAFSYPSAAVASAALQEAAKSFGMVVRVTVNDTPMPICTPRRARITGEVALNTKPKG